VTIAVVGLSHLGIVASACLAASGFDVVAVGDDAPAVAALSVGKPPIHEPGLDELLAATPARFTTDFAALSAADLVLVALDTATDDANRADLSALDGHLDRALPSVAAGATIVLMSQVPVGFTRALDARLRARRPDFTGRLHYWVETLVLGDAVARFRVPERIIVGGPSDAPQTDPALDAVLAQFGCPVFRMRWESAELAKAAINLYLGVSVTFANALADLAEATGASMRAIVPALRSDRRIGAHAYVRPGLGIAGGNLERDLVHLRDLAGRSDVDDALFRLVLDASAQRYTWLTRALDRHVFAAGGRRLAIWGLAYKKNTASTKNAVALRLLHDLAGRVSFAVYDPVAMLPGGMAGVEVAASARAALSGADGLAILTDWDEFAAWDPSALRAALGRPVVIDPLGVLDADRARAAGLTHVAIGEAP
jgi:UDPglucose 6-dehydrogenase